MEIESTHIPVLELLRQASSQIPALLQPAEAKLKEWETQPGFYSVLNRISTCASDVNVRLLATMYVKHGVDKYWNAKSSHVISNEEKSNIRQELLSNFAEPIHQIAAQKAVLISKIALVDYPSKKWPELFTVLLTAVDNPNDVVQHRSLLTLHHVVKALAPTRDTFREFAVKIYAFLLNFWNSYTEAFVRDVLQNAGDQDITVNLEKSLLALRILKKLTAFGFSKPHEHGDCVAFLKAAFERTQTGLHCRKQLQGQGKSTHVLELCEKFVVNTTKALVAILEVSQNSFIDFIRPVLEFTFHCLFTEEGIGLVFERFSVQCFNIIGEILLRFQSREVKRIRKAEVTPAQEVIQAFFQPHVLLDMCRKMVGHYFILTQAELDLWKADSEEFSKDDGDLGWNFLPETVPQTCAWKYSLRTSVVKVFAAVFHEFSERLTPLVHELVASTNVLVSPQDLQGILKKDAAYNALALCSSDAKGVIDIDKWFERTIARDLTVKHANYRVIRRRAIILVGQWTPQLTHNGSLRPVMYDCINSLLTSDEDMAVRLAAASTLCRAVHFAAAFQFDELSKASLNTAFALLFSALEQSKECSTKLQVLKAMTFLLNKSYNAADLQLDCVVRYLPCLWTEAEGHDMLRCAVVSSLVTIINSLADVKPELRALVIRILDLGTDTSQNAIDYLFEYCLDLWHTTLTHSPTVTDDLMRLFDRMPSLLGYSPRTLRKCLQICAHQILIAPEPVMLTTGVHLVPVLGSLLSELDEYNDAMALMRVVEIAIQASPLLGTQTMLPILPKVFGKMFGGHVGLTWCMSKTLRILARVLLSSQEAFSQAVIALAGAYNETELALLGRILDVWLDKMRNVSTKTHKKLLALALASLLTTRSETVFERIRPIMSDVRGALDATTIIAPDGTMTESLTYGEEDVYDCDHHSRRMKQLTSTDVVNRIILREYVQSQLGELRNQLGEQQFLQVLQRVDEYTVSRLREYNVLL